MAREAKDIGVGQMIFDVVAATVSANSLSLLVATCRDGSVVYMD